MAKGREVGEEEEPLEVLISKGVESIPSRFILPAQYRPYSSLLPVPSNNNNTVIPLIDLSLLHLPSSRSSTLSQIHSACCHSGFFQIINHGLSPSLFQSLHRGIHEFLQLPPAQKCSPGFGSAFVNPQVGAAEWRDYLVLRTFPESVVNSGSWPQMLKDPVAAFSAEILSLARLLLSVFSENLQLPSSFIEEAMGVLNQKILISHYPPCPRPDLVVGACEHTDVGAITCVWQTSEDVVGLQVRQDGEWHSVEPLHGAIVVNVGDQVEVLSNGLYKSGSHRVVLNKSKPRISVVAFHNPSANATIAPIDSLIDTHHRSLYQPTTFRAYASKYAVKIE